MRGGFDGRIRFLKNVMGLWLMNECVATWREAGLKTSVEDLVEEAARYEKPLGIFDVNDPIFMPGRNACSNHRMVGKT